MKEILLVEDSDPDAQSVERALRALGVVNPVRRLRHGVEAMDYLMQAEQIAAVGPPLPSVLLLDVGLPGVSGFQILTYLQNRPAFAATLKLMISQLGDINSIKQAYALGAQSFLTKPINQTELRELITGFPSHWLLNAGGRVKRSFASS